MLLEVTPGHLHVLSHVSALEAQEPSQLVGDEAAGTTVVKEQHRTDVVGEVHVDHVEHDLGLLAYLLGSLIHGHLATNGVNVGHLGAMQHLAV